MEIRKSGRAERGGHVMYLKWNRKWFFLRAQQKSTPSDQGRRLRLALESHSTMARES